MQAAATGAAARAPQRLARPARRPRSPACLRPGGVRWTRWRTSARIRTFTDLLLLLKLLAELGPWNRSGRSPRSGDAGRPPRPPASTRDLRDRLLTRIRGLLAKAEATDHPAEAETFTAKAQELMTRHAVDEAVLRGRQHEDIPVASRRVHLQSPYANVKATLLNAVARPNRCRMVLHERVRHRVLVGTPTDVDQTELLFTSLLIQATRAMAEAGTRRAAFLRPVGDVPQVVPPRLRDPGRRAAARGRPVHDRHLRDRPRARCSSARRTRWTPSSSGSSRTRGRQARATSILGAGRRARKPQTELRSSLVGSPRDQVAYGQLAAFSILYTLPIIALYGVLSKALGGGFSFAGGLKG